MCSTSCICLKSLLCFRCVLFFRHVVVACFFACVLAAQSWYTPSHARVHAGFPQADLFAKRALFDGALPASSVNVGFPHKDLLAKPALHGGASSTSPVIQPQGSTVFAVTGWRPEAAILECRASGDAGVDRLRRSLLPLFSAPARGSELEFHTQRTARSHRAREPGGERTVQDEGRTVRGISSRISRWTQL